MSLKDTGKREVSPEDRAELERLLGAAEPNDGQGVCIARAVDGGFEVECKVLASIEMQAAFCESILEGLAGVAPAYATPAVMLKLIRQAQGQGQAPDSRLFDPEGRA